MKLFFKQIAIFLFILLIIIGSIEWKYRNYTSPVESVFLKYTYQKDVVNLLYIGNSHMGALRKKKIYDKDIVQNLSLGGQDLFHIKTILEKAISESKNLKRIVLGLDYEFIGYDYVVANQMWKDRLYYSYTKKLYSHSLGDLMMAHSGFYKSNRNLTLLFKNIPQFDIKKVKEKEHEFIIPKKTTISIEKQCKNRAKEHSFVKIDTGLSLKNAKYLKEIVSLCKNNEIELICITLPKQKMYENYFNKEVIKLAKKLFLPILEENSIKYINLWQSPLFNTEDFVDADHLNNKGVAKIINILKNK